MMCNYNIISSAENEIKCNKVVANGDEYIIKTSTTSEFLKPVKLDPKKYNLPPSAIIIQGGEFYVNHITVNYIETNREFVIWNKIMKTPKIQEQVLNNIKNDIIVHDVIKYSNKFAVLYTDYKNTCVDIIVCKGLDQCSIIEKYVVAEKSCFGNVREARFEFNNDLYVYLTFYNHVCEKWQLKDNSKEMIYSKKLVK